MLIGSMVGKPPSSNKLFLINSFRHPKNIEDTGETFASDFPAMLELYVSSSHVVCLVYAVDDWVTFEHVATSFGLPRKSIEELLVEYDWLC